MQATAVAGFGIFVAALSTTISEANKLLSLVPALPLPNRRSTAPIFLESRDISQYYRNCYESRIIDSSCFRRRISMRSGIVDSLAS